MADNSNNAGQKYDLNTAVSGKNEMNQHDCLQH